MDKQLVAKLIGPATIVALAGIFAIDLHLTRKARLEAMRIIAESEKNEASNTSDQK